MERVCFVLQVKPDLVEEYREVHEAVWPRMLRAIERAGRRNYSLFLQDDGLLVGYYETDDRAASEHALAQDPDTSEWEARAERFFTGRAGRPDQGVAVLREVFHLESQLRRLTDQPPP